jgi:hypothetical protein
VMVVSVVSSWEFLSVVNKVPARHGQDVPINPYVTNGQTLEYQCGEERPGQGPALQQRRMPGSPREGRGEAPQTGAKPGATMANIKAREGEAAVPTRSGQVLRPCKE